MNIRKKLAVAAAIVLPLSSAIALGGIQAASAGGGPLLTCPNTTADSGTISFNSGSTGIYLNSNAGQTAELTADAYGASTSISINKLAITGQTLTIAGITTGGIDGNGTFLVAGDVEPNAPSADPTDVTLSTPLPTTTAKGNILEKTKDAVTVNATDGTNNTTAYNASNTEDMTFAVSGCSSSVTVAGDFSPTEATINGTSTVSNAATGLEAAPPPLSTTVTFPPIGSGWVQPVTTSMSFSVAKADTLNLSTFAISYGDGVVTGDYASAKAGALHLNALDAMTVCTAGELEAIGGTGPDNTGNGGLIATGADPLSVCDGGTLNYNAQTGVGGAYPANGLDEILAAETNNTGGPDNGGDGTPVLAIWAIQVNNSGQGNEVI